MSKFDSIRSKYASGETKRQGKEFTRTESFVTGGESGLGWGFLDEASGTKSAIQNVVRRKGVPEPLIKGAEFVTEKLNPLTRLASGTANAATGVVAENLAPQDSRIMRDYRKARDDRRDIEARASADNPLSYGTGYFTGAVASGPPIATGGRIVGGVKALKAGNVGKNVSTIAKGVGKYGLEGAAYAGSTAFGSAEGDIGERAKESVLPTVIGLGAGAVLGPTLQYVISPIAKGVGYHFFTPDDLKAIDMVIKRAERSGTDLKQVRADFDAWNKTGEVPETLAELMGPNERGLLSAVISANRETLERAGETFAARGRGEVTRLEDRMTAAMGATRDDFAKAEQAAAQARAQDPEPFYMAAHFDNGMQRKFLNQKDTEQFAYTLARNDFGRSTLSGAADYADMMQQPAVRDEIRAFAKALQDGKTPNPLSVQAADYIERGVNRQLNRASQGHIQDIPSGIRALRDRLRAVVDPYGVGEARATAAERIRRGELLQEGRQFLRPSTDIEDINKTMRGDPELDIAPASDEGRRMYGVGATRAMSGELRNAPDMAGFANVARKLARTPAIREKVEAVRPKKLTKSGAEDMRYKQTRSNAALDEELSRVANRAQFAVDMVGNSRTSFREADKLAAAADDTLQSAIGDAVSDVLQGGPSQASQNMWRRGTTAFGNYLKQPGAYNPNINRHIADILLAQGDQIPAQLQRLAQRQAQRSGIRAPTSSVSSAAINQPSTPMRSAGFNLQRPQGFLDDIPRGTQRFYDERLTAGENKAVEMARNGYSNAEIAEELETSTGTVKVLLSKARNKGVDVPKARNAPPSTAAESLYPRFERGQSDQQISQITGMNPKTVATHRVRFNNARRAAGEKPISSIQWRNAGGIGEDVQSSLMAGLAGNAGGDTAGRFIDLNQDGVVDEKDRQLGRQVGSLAAGAPLAIRGASAGRNALRRSGPGRKPTVDPLNYPGRRAPNMRPQVGGGALEVPIRSAYVPDHIQPSNRPASQLLAKDAGVSQDAYAPYGELPDQHYLRDLQDMREAFGTNRNPVGMSPETADGLREMVLDAHTNMKEIIAQNMGYRSFHELPAGQQQEVAQQAVRNLLQDVKANDLNIQPIRETLGGGGGDEIPTLTAGVGGKRPPKPPPIPGAGTGPKNRKHLGRGLRDLTDDNVIPMPQRKPANMGEGRTPEQLAGPYGGKPPSQWTPEEREFFVQSGHGSTADLDGGFAREYQTVDEVKKLLGRKGMKRANQGGQYDTEGMPVVAPIIAALGLAGGGAAVATHMSRNKADSRIPPGLSQARDEAAKAVADAYQNNPNSREFQVAVIRLQQIDREIERLKSGNLMETALMPPSRKPVAAN